ncbi:hypothetical protein PHJA_002153500, partial [Phtheirospermum japonicum]
SSVNHQTHSLYLSSLAIIARCSAPDESFPRIAKLSAIDPDGHRQEVIGLSCQTLLKALTNKGLIDLAQYRLKEIDACSVECEVHIN